MFYVLEIKTRPYKRLNNIVTILVLIDFMTHTQMAYTHVYARMVEYLSQLYA